MMSKLTICTFTWSPRSLAELSVLTLNPTMILSLSLFASLTSASPIVPDESESILNFAPSTEILLISFSTASAVPMDSALMITGLTF